jgi:hypothetical protein
MAKAAALGVGAVAVGAGVLAKGFVDAAIESQKVTKQTEAVIKSMGGASNVTADQVAKLSTKLSLKSGVDDELIQSGSNLLLTFGKVRNEIGKGNDIFDRANAAALDMSVAMGTDMKSAAMQVGKALNDPVKGLSKLSRSGIQFTKQQEDQIKAMAKVGDTAGAQKIMLAELERQFGGSAEAQATAGDKLKVVWGNLQEELGSRLLPMFEKVAEWASVALPKALDAISGWWDDNGPGIIAAVTDFGDKAGEVFGAIVAAVRSFVEEAGPPIKAWVDDVLGTISAWWDDHGDTVLSAIEALKEGVELAFEALIVAGEFVVEHWDKFKVAAAGMAAVVIGHYVRLGAAATLSAAQQVAAWATATVAAAVSKAETVAIVALMIADWARLAAASILNAAKVVGSWVVIGLKAIWAAGVTAVQIAIMVAKWIWLGAVAMAQAAKVALAWVIALGPIALLVAAAIGLAYVIYRNWDTIKQKTSEVKDWIVEKFGAVVEFFKGIPGRLAGAAGGMFDFIKSAFRNAINAVIGMWNGIKFPSLTIGGQDPLGIFGPSLPEVTIGGWELPNIPRLAQGGNIPGALNQPRLILAHGGEYLTQASATNRGGTGGGGTVNIYLSSLDPKGAGVAVVEALKAYTKTNGPIPIAVRA